MFPFWIHQQITQWCLIINMAINLDIWPPARSFFWTLLFGICSISIIRRDGGKFPLATLDGAALDPWTPKQVYLVTETDQLPKRCVWENCWWWRVSRIMALMPVWLASVLLAGKMVVICEMCRSSSYLFTFPFPCCLKMVDRPCEWLSRFAFRTSLLLFSA